MQFSVAKSVQFSVAIRGDGLGEPRRAVLRPLARRPYQRLGVHRGAEPAHRRVPDTIAVERRSLRVYGEVDAGAWTPLVAIEDLGRTIALERLSQGRDAEARLERVGQAPGQHRPIDSCSSGHRKGIESWLPV